MLKVGPGVTGMCHAWREPVVVGVAPERPAGRVLTWAADWAARSSAGVEVVACLAPDAVPPREWPDHQRATQNRVGALAAEVSMVGSRLATPIVEGGAIMHFVELGSRGHPVVLGTHWESGGWRRALAGSVPLTVAALNRGPVTVLVPDEGRRVLTGAVVLVSDPSDAAARALAVREAASLGVAVIEDPQWRRPQEGQSVSMVVLGRPGPLSLSGFARAVLAHRIASGSGVPVAIANDPFA
ncbi:MAG TPA: universal stress protein [Propionibacterium sp.]|nr:universal stress protein [Propionibacterium sp.]